MQEEDEAIRRTKKAGRRRRQQNADDRKNIAKQIRPAEDTPPAEGKSLNLIKLIDHTEKMIAHEQRADRIKVRCMQHQV